MKEEICMYIGIVAEWNPFHTGHQSLITAVREMYPKTPVIGAMSGAFVQRGEPAVFDKWSRAGWALSAGVSAVVELPVLCAVRSADHFAAAGVRLLADMGITHLAFGTESFDADALTAIALWTLSPDFLPRLHAFLDTGIPYSRAVNLAIAEKFPELEEGLSRPNNLLGIQYARTILADALPITLLPIRRGDNPASATAIRREIAAGLPPSHIPDEEAAEIAALIAGGCYTDYTRYDDACLLASRTKTLEALAASGLFSEGLENKWHAESSAASYEDMLDAIKNKRYLMSRLRRIGAALLLTGDILPSPFAASPRAPYARLLALKKDQSEILRHAKIPVITSFARAEKSASPLTRQYLAADRRATDMQAWCMHAVSARKGRMDYYHSPVIR